MDGNGFTVVKAKRNKRHINKKKHYIKPETKIIIMLNDMDLEGVAESIQRIRNSMKSSVFLQNVGDILNAANTSIKVGDIVSYGIGSINQCKIAQHQFALLLNAIDVLQVSKERVNLYDPCFTKADEEIITRFNLNIINLNEEGKRSVQTKGTLFYMPHCGRPLYNNVLRSNWYQEKMESFIIIGNSFQNIVSNSTDKNLSEKYPSIYKVYQYMNEHPLPDYDERNDVFNDTSIHVFSKEKFKFCPNVDTFWEIPKDVDYNEDQEIIRSTKDICN